MSRSPLRSSCLIMLVMLGLPLRAQIKTDGSMGARQALSGPNFAIPANLGKQAGGNLFHSFTDFNIQTGQSATFSGPTSVRNVLARVTGGSASTIDGALRCDIAGANLYLMNPAGVLFNANATLDISGSFAVTSADSIRLGKSARFNAAPVSGEVLSSAAPSAFGFLQRGSGDIALSGATLQVGAGKSISIVANGDIRLSSSGLAAPGGRVNLVAAAGVGQVAFDPGAPQSPVDSSVKSSANITADTGSVIDVSGDAGGAIVIRAANLALNHSALLSVTHGTSPGQTIDAQLAGEFTMRNGSALNLSTDGNAAGGSLDVRAAQINLSGGSQIFADTTGPVSGGRLSFIADAIALDGAGTLILADPVAGATGRGAEVFVAARSLAVMGGASLANQSFGGGVAGNLTVRANEVLIHGIGPDDATTGIIAGTSSGTTGDGGNVLLRAARLQIDSGGLIEGNTAGTGRASNIHIVANSIDLRDNGTFIQSNSTASDSGAAGIVRIDAATLSLTANAKITADTIGAGAGGSIDVRASGSVFLRGDDSGIQAITSATGNAGHAGNVNVTADSVALTKGAFIISGTAGSGDGGAVSVSAQTLTLRRRAVIGNSSTADAAGNAGSVAIRAGLVSISDDALITSATYGSGNAGNVDIRADRLLINGDGSDATGLFAASLGGSGAAGGITIHRTGSVELENSGVIRVDTAGSGAAGSLNIDARTLTLSHGLIFAASAAPVGGGPGGRLLLDVDRLAVSGGGGIGVGTFGSGAGGTALIRARSITLQGIASDTPDASSTAIAVGTSGTGAGGKLTLDAQSLNISNGAAIAVGTNGPGNGGDAIITARSVILDRGGIIAGSKNQDTSAGPATGNAGTIVLHAGKSLSLRNGSTIGAKADLSNGGSVTVQSPRLTLRDSTISAEAGRNGGSINVLAEDVLYLSRSQITAIGQQSLGDITIDPLFTVLDQSSIVTTTQANGGGNINLRTDRLFKSLDSVITAAQGATITLTIYTPQANITGSLVPVNASLIDSSASFIEECSRRLQVDLSSFLITGRGGQPPEPGGLNPAFELRSTPSTAPAR